MREWLLTMILPVIIKSIAINSKFRKKVQGVFVDKIYYDVVYGLRNVMRIGNSGYDTLTIRTTNEGIETCYYDHTPLNVGVFSF